MTREANISTAEFSNSLNSLRGEVYKLDITLKEIKSAIVKPLTKAVSVDGKSDGNEGRILEQKNKLDEIITKIKTDVRNKIEAVGGKIFDDLGAALLDGLFGDGSKLRDFRRQLKSTLRALGLDILKTILSSVEGDILTRLKDGLKEILDSIFGPKKEPAANGNGASGAADPIGILASVLPGGGILGGIAQAVAALPLPSPLPFAEGGRFASGQALLVGERGPAMRSTA